MSPKEIREPDSVTLEAVYNLNKHAKKYARLASENFQSNKGATAKANSVKKDALYGVKSRAINRFLIDGKDSLKDVERHEINETVYLCLYFADENGTVWSFHQRENEAHSGRFPERIDVADRAPEDFADFESGEEKERSTLSLKAALLHLEACGINANDYLDQNYVYYGYNRSFVGWKYLGDGGKTIEQNSDSEKTTTEIVECGECGQECKGQRGLSIHQTAAHSKNRERPEKSDEIVVRI